MTDRTLPQSVISTDSVLIIAGEASGDLLGADLVRAICSRCPGIRFWGIGGDAMAAQNVSLLFHVRELGVTGFSEVIRKLPVILHVMATVEDLAVREKPSAAILIDYPDFNLRLAKKLKAAGIPIIYYVSPQLWAWRSGRVRVIRRFVDTMMVLFPFEETWYHQRGVRARFVGHPVLDRVKTIPDRKRCRQMLGLAPDAFIVAMLPGSRVNEVRRSLPIFTEAQGILIDPCETPVHEPDQHPVHFILPLADTVSTDLIRSLLPSGPQPHIIQGQTLMAVRAADIAWITSGTACLEAALLHTPHVVVYRTSPITYWIARHLISVKAISIANIVMPDPVVPELIQTDFNPRRLVEETRKIVQSTESLEAARDRLRALDSQFGRPGAADRAAQEVLRTLGIQRLDNPL
ncbi:lipid-A-disaccharide synthase [bacterium]|nr:lipid-A-disaccharide synthase [candidate division CSSED10-310 bacterium]